MMEKTNAQILSEAGAVFVDKVRAECGPDVICQQCEATIDTFAARCHQGNLIKKCQGYMAIEEATRRVLGMQEIARG